MIWGSNFLETTNCMFSMSSWVCRSGSNSSLMFWQEAMRYNVTIYRGPTTDDVRMLTKNAHSEKDKKQIPSSPKKTEIGIPSDHPIPFWSARPWPHGQDPELSTHAPSDAMEVIRKNRSGESSRSATTMGMGEESHGDLEIVSWSYCRWFIW